MAGTPRPKYEGKILPGVVYMYTSSTALLRMSGSSTAPGSLFDQSSRVQVSGGGKVDVFWHEARNLGPNPSLQVPALVLCANIIHSRFYCGRNTTCGE